MRRSFGGGERSQKRREDVRGRGGWVRNSKESRHAERDPAVVISGDSRALPGLPGWGSTVFVTRIGRVSKSRLCCVTCWCGRGSGSQPLHCEGRSRFRQNFFGSPYDSYISVWGRHSKVSQVVWVSPRILAAYGSGWLGSVFGPRLRGVRQVRWGPKTDPSHPTSQNPWAHPAVFFSISKIFRQAQGPLTGPI